MEKNSKNRNQLVDDNGYNTENCFTDNLISRNKTTNFLFSSISTLSFFIMFCYHLMTIIIFLVFDCSDRQQTKDLQLVS